MKMILVVYSHAADYDVIAAFKKVGIKGYTKLEKVAGEGCETEPKLHTHTWPGENNMLLIALDEDSMLEPLMAQMRSLKGQHPRAGLKAFILPLEQIL